MLKQLISNHFILSPVFIVSVYCGLEVLEESLPSIKHFFFVPDIPIKIFKILLKGEGSC